MPERVCIVGAGVAGLVSAKVLRDDGFDVTVFEKADDVGGVWLESRTYPDVRTNTPREAYAFSDVPYPETADDFPTAGQVRRYLASYCDGSGVRDRIRFSTEVTSVERIDAPTSDTSGRFRVTAVDANHRHAAESFDVDFVVVCNGLFSRPHVPSIPGGERFEGAVVHSSELRDKHLGPEARVVVVGAGKSALDCATAASARSGSCTLLFRSPHWTAPQRLLGIRYDRVLFTRAAEAFYRYHRLRGPESLLHGPAAPLVKAYWRLQSWLIPRLLDMPKELVPEEPLPGDLNVGVGGAFYEAVHAGRAVPLQGEIASLGPGRSVQLRSGDVLAADLVVFATGWRRELPFLEPGLRDALVKNGRFRLFRHVLPPREQRLGFIGYAQSFMSPLTSEIAAHWLSQHFRGELDLPSATDMDQEIDRVLAWASDTFPEGWGGFFIGPHISHYVDDLMEDMGLPTRRVGSVLREIFGRYSPVRYRSVHDERRRAREGKRTEA